MSIANHRFVRAVQDAMRGDSTTLGANPQQSEKDLAVSYARTVVASTSGGRLVDPEVLRLAQQYLRELGLG